MWVVGHCRGQPLNLSRWWHLEGLAESQTSSPSFYIISMSLDQPMALILQHPYKVFPWSFPLNQVLHVSNNRLRRRWPKRLKMVPTRSATPGVRIKLPWLGIAVPAWLTDGSATGNITQSLQPGSLACWKNMVIYSGEKICHRSCLRTSESSISAWHVEILGASSSTTIYRCDVSTQPLPIWSMFFDVWLMSVRIFVEACTFVSSFWKTPNFCINCCIGLCTDPVTLVWYSECQQFSVFMFEYVWYVLLLHLCNATGALS